jgi:pilus assembly protein CpaB
MSLRTALALAIVLGLGGIGMVAWIGLQLPHKPGVVAKAAPAPPVKVQILAAARVLHAGSLLKYDDIQPHEVLLPDMPPGARTDSPRARAELIGAMVRRNLQPQEPLLPADLLLPGDHGFLAAVLRPGMRATAVGVDAVSGTAGLIWPGDHVDVILTQVTDDKSLPAAHRASAEAVLGDVRVIAIDQQLMQGGTGSTTEQGGNMHTVTLEVTEAQAQRVTLAERLGHLSLIVRSADAPPGPQNAVLPTTWGGDISPALTQGAAAGRSIRVYEGTAEVKELRF